MRKDKLWPLVVLLAIFLWCLRAIQGFDIWFYIETGRLVVEEFTIPWAESFLGTTDTYAFHRHANQAWLSSVVCYLAYKLGGVGGLVFLKSGLLTATAALTYRNCRLYELSRSWSALLVLLGVWSVRSRFLLRSVLFTDLLLAALLFLLIRHQKDPEGPKLPYLPLGFLFVIWTNTHQGVMAGCFLLFWWLLTRRFEWKTRLQALFVAGACTLVRPYGWWFPYFYLEHFGNNTAVRDVMEWAPLGLKAFLLNLGPLCLLGLLALLLAARQDKVPWGNAIVALLFLLLASRSQRAVGEILPVVVPLIASYLARLELPRKALAPVALTLGLLLYLHAPPWPGVQLTRLAHKYPEGLLQALPEQHGQVFNSYEFGNYLVFRGKRPFIHGITSLFREQLVLDFNAILNRGPKRKELLEKFQVEEVLLHHPTEVDSTEQLVQDLFDSPDWYLWWWDDSGYLFRKTSGQDLKAIRPWVVGEHWSDAEAAKEQLEEMLKQRPSALALTYRAQLYQQEGQSKEALELLDKALQLSPYSYQALLLKGSLNFQIGDLDSSEEALALAARVAPQSPIVHFNLALLYLKTERTDQARKELRRVLELDPEFQQAKVLLRKF